MEMEIRGLEKLSFREKQVVALREQGLSREAIAKKLKISVSTIATLYNRARAKGYEVVLIIPGDVLIPPDLSEEGDGNSNESSS